MSKTGLGGLFRNASGAVAPTNPSTVGGRSTAGRSATGKSTDDESSIANRSVPVPANLSALRKVSALPKEQRPARVLVPALVLALQTTSQLGGCVGETPASDLAAPDTSRILVFFPINGTVYGRGGVGSVQDPRSKYVCIREPFASYSNCNVPVASDGSFSFSLRAVSDDVLEFASAEDSAGKVRGAFAFVRVPQTPSPRPALVCCKNTGQTTGVCQQQQSVEEGDPCDSPIPNLTRLCTDDRICAADAHETLDMDASSINVTAPNAQGIVTFTGQALPQTLVRLENRGQRSVITNGLAGRDPNTHFSIIANEDGSFEFPRVPARAHDELILQFLTLNDDRSPEASFIVPSPPLAGVDIIGVENFDALTEGEEGTIAIKIAPYGTDGYGLCPPSEEEPILCFGGGLTQSMVHFTEATIDAISTPPSATPTSTDFPVNRGTQGDPLGGPLTIVAVVDMSAKTSDLDPNKTRLAALSNFLHRRTRDKIGVVGYGPATPIRIDPVANDQVDALINVLAATVPDGGPDVFGGVKLAGDILNAANAYDSGRVIVLALDNPVDTNTKTVAEAFEQAWDVVGEDPDTGFGGFPVFILPANIANPDSYLSDLASFTGGGLYAGAGCAAQLNQTLARLAGDIFGSFVLLYDVRIPEGRGKSATINLGMEVTVRSPDNTIQTMMASYEGPLVIANATGNEVPICP